MAMEVNEQTLAAHNEAGHGIEAILQGRFIDTMYIFPSSNGDGSWGGMTDADEIGRHVGCPLPSQAIYERLGRTQQAPLSPYELWECCAYKLTAVEAEKWLCELNGIDSSTQRIAKQDIEDAKICVANLSLELGQRILDDAQVRGRQVLEDPDCWKAVELMAQALIEAQARTEKPYLTGDEVYAIVSKALSLPPIEDEVREMLSQSQPRYLMWKL